MRVRAHVGGGRGVDAGAAAALHIERVSEDCNLVVFSLERQVATDLLEKGPGPGAGGGDDDWAFDLALLGANAADVAVGAQEFRHLSTGKICRTHVAGAGEEVVGNGC